MGTFGVRVGTLNLVNLSGREEKFVKNRERG